MGIFKVHGLGRRAYTSCSVAGCDFTGITGSFQLASGLGFKGFGFRV